MPENQPEEKVEQQADLQKPEESPIEEAKKILEDTKKTLEELREERKKFEKAQAGAMMSGRGMAGTAPKPREETPEEYSKRILNNQI